MTPTLVGGAVDPREARRPSLNSLDDSLDDVLMKRSLFNTRGARRRRAYSRFFFLAPALVLALAFGAVGGCSSKRESDPQASTGAAERKGADSKTNAPPSDEATVVAATDSSTKNANAPPSRGPPTPPLAPIAATRFDAAFSKASYIGSQACGECHSEQHEHYMANHHSRSLRETDEKQEPPDGEFVDSTSGRGYRAFREGGKFVHRETTAQTNSPGAAETSGEPLTLAEYAQELTVGSGTNAHTYLAFAEGFCFESPLTWYAKRGEWRLSPGYENDNSGFARPVYIECLSCHAGRVESLDGGRGKFTVRQLAIDCERCHGPGSQHAAYWADHTEAPAEGDVTIVNPARLARRESEAICAQCHFDTFAEAEIRGRELSKFLPGQAIDDYRVHYTATGGENDPQAEDMRIVGHTEQLRLSRCYQESETLTCTTCHDTHSPAPADKISAFRTKCLDCHQENSCGAPRADRQAQNDNCMVCHMPPTDTEIPHVAATHHRIGVRGRAKAAAPPDFKPIGLAPLTEIVSLSQLDRDRCEGLGWLSLSLRTAEPQASEAFRVRARDVLEKVREDGMNDPGVDAALASIYQIENPDRAVELGQLALKSPTITPKHRLRALEAVAKSQVNARRIKEAISPLSFLVGLRRQAADWYLLAVCRYQEGDIPGALAAAENAAKIRPDNLRVYELLAELYKHNNQLDRATEAEERRARIAAARPK